MGGSLALLADRFEASRLQLGGLLGESDFGPASPAITALLEGGLFAGCIVGPMMVAGRRE